MSVINNDKCIIFDFDYTIAATIENIWVWSPRGTRNINNKKYYPLHPKELQNIGIGDDEKIDDDSFVEFYDIDISKVVLIEPVLNVLKLYCNLLNNQFYILSARPQSVEKKIENILSSSNINTNLMQYIGLTNSSPLAKIDYINDELLKSYHDELVIYEDSIIVIDKAKEKFSKNLKCKFNLVEYENHSNTTIKYWSNT